MPPDAQQIGQTGRIVPKLLPRGRQTAGTIIGVNRDPDAPIAEFADLVVVGDLFEVGKALLEMLRART
jgi:electron transfer flavoprotein alpha subunit